MSNSLIAIIAKNVVTHEFSQRWLMAKTIKLPQEFSLILLSDDLLDNINELIDSNKDKPFKEFDFFSASLKEALEDISFVGEVGYIETEYFGGSGYQSAIVLAKAKAVYGPLETTDEWNGEGYIQNPEGSRAVNGALKTLGVWVKDDRDEWDMLGLSKYRHGNE